MKKMSNKKTEGKESKDTNVVAAVIGAIIGVIGTVGASVIGVIPDIQTNTYKELESQYEELKDKYTELENKYIELENEYNDLAYNKYWVEYSAEEKGLIVDKTVDCSIVIDYIGPDYIDITVHSGTDMVNDYKMHRNDQIDIDENGKYSLLITSVDYNYGSGRCDFIIKEN